MSQDLRPPSLSIVLPCYNECGSIPDILSRFAEAGRGYHFELILVDNGSTDATPTVLETLLPQYDFARTIRIDPNHGYGHGIFSGLQAARGRVLAWSHADLQTDPADIFRAYDQLEHSPDTKRQIIKGQRYGRRLSEKMISMGMQILASTVLRTKLHEINAQPKVFDRTLLAGLVDPPIDFNFDLYVLYIAHHHGWKIHSIPVRFPPRQYGESKWAATWRSKIRTISKSIAYMMRLAKHGVGEPTVAPARSSQPDVCGTIPGSVERSRAA